MTFERRFGLDFAHGIRGRRMVSAIAGACFLVAAGPGVSEGMAQARAAGGRVLTVKPPPSTDVREAYQTAMGRYAAHWEGVARELRAFLIPRPQRFFWTWTNGSGRVQRASPGIYTASTDDCLSRFCRQVFCQTAAWPMFDCSDGRQRRMSAPDLDTMILDGVAYHRLQPLPLP